MSNLVGQILLKVHAKLPGLEAHVIASALAIVCGGIITFVWLDPVWMARGIYSTGGNLGLHDRVRNQYCSWPSPHHDGNHRF
jgi:hypothetical protein